MHVFPRHAAALAAFALVLAVGARAQADPDFGNLDLVVAVVEAGFPDARLEVNYEDDYATLLLAWPYVLELGVWGGDHGTLQQYLEVSAEYQLAPIESDSRGVAAVRTGLLHRAFDDNRVGLGVEVGGVSGTDGRGLMAGTAISLVENREDSGSFSMGVQLLYRHYLLEDGQRGEFALDFRFPHRAFSDRYREWTFLEQLIAVASFMPNVWWEFDDDYDGSVTLSIALSGPLSDRDDFGATLFIEPQYQTVHHEVRGHLGTRAMWVPIADNIGPLVEASAVAGTDGVGAALGAGLTIYYDDSRGATAISAVYRRTWTFDEHRHAVTLDLQMTPF